MYSGVYCWEEATSEDVEICVMFVLFNAFVNDLEGRVRSSLLKFIGLLNWEVPVTLKKGKKKKDLERIVRIEGLLRISSVRQIQI